MPPPPVEKGLLICLPSTIGTSGLSADMLSPYAGRYLPPLRWTLRDVKRLSPAYQVVMGSQKICHLAPQKTSPPYTRPTEEPLPRKGTQCVPFCSLAPFAIRNLT